MSARDKQAGGNHYKVMAIQPWDVIDTWPLEQQIGFYRGNQLKYIMRAGEKSGEDRLKEIEKANHYGEKLAEVMHNAELAAARTKIDLNITTLETVEQLYAGRHQPK